MARVPLHLDIFGALLDSAPAFLKKFGQLETKLLEFDIVELKVDKPVFISGLARSGSTILLEILNDHRKSCSFQYRDYPFIHINYFWNTARKLIPTNTKKVERAHKDRVLINNQSPEALDEILWMSFFDDLHNTDIKNTLDTGTSNPQFEAFYREALLKLLALRKAQRVVLKNNYNVARLPYLKKFFPDARFAIPIRKPEEHVYSMVKQHTLLKTAQEKDKRGLRYMKRHGHFEFGQDFRPVNFGDQYKTDLIRSEFAEQNYTDAYARYWAEYYTHLHTTLQENPKLKENCLIVRYDDLCTNPKAEIENILSFCDLKDPDLAEKWAKDISAPEYYTNDFTDSQRADIKRLTQETEKLFWN